MTLLTDFTTTPNTDISTLRQQHPGLMDFDAWLG
jgi:hypothetical protein